MNTTWNNLSLSLVLLLVWDYPTDKPYEVEFEVQFRKRVEGNWNHYATTTNRWVLIETTNNTKCFYRVGVHKLDNIK